MAQRIALPVVVLLLIAGCTGGGFRAETDFSQTVAWDGYECVEVRTGNGAVELRPADRTDVVISGTKFVRGHTQAEADASLDDIEIYADQHADNPRALLVELRYPSALKHQSPGARLLIEVPEPCAARIRTGNGRITVANLVGPLELASGNGRITATDIDGDVAVDTGNGSITVRDIRGSCDLNTSNGRVEADDVQGTLRIRTSNGRVKAGVTPSPTDAVELATSNGRIELDIPAALAASLELRTGNGRITTELGDAPLTQVAADKSSFRAKLNGGGCKVSAESSNGSITVRTR